MWCQGLTLGVKTLCKAGVFATALSLWPTKTDVWSLVPPIWESFAVWYRRCYRVSVLCSLLPDIHVLPLATTTCCESSVNPLPPHMPGVTLVLLFVTSHTTTKCWVSDALGSLNFNDLACVFSEVSGETGPLFPWWHSGMWGVEGGCPPPLWESQTTVPRIFVILGMSVEISREAVNLRGCAVVWGAGVTDGALAGLMFGLSSSQGHPRVFSWKTYEFQQLGFYD